MTVKLLTLFGVSLFNRTLSLHLSDATFLEISCRGSYYIFKMEPEIHIPKIAFTLLEFWQRVITNGCKTSGQTPSSIQYI